MDRYPTTVVRAEGTRISLVTCDVCHLPILVDPRHTEDTVAAHLAWHQARRRRTEIERDLATALLVLGQIRDAEDATADRLQEMAGAGLRKTVPLEAAGQRDG